MKVAGISDCCRRPLVCGILRSQRYSSLSQESKEGVNIEGLRRDTGIKLLLSSSGPLCPLHSFRSKFTTVRTGQTGVLAPRLYWHQASFTDTHIAATIFSTLTCQVHSFIFFLTVSASLTPMNTTSDEAEGVNIIYITNLFY